jgi:phospholipase C
VSHGAYFVRIRAQTLFFYVLLGGALVACAGGSLNEGNQALPAAGVRLKSSPIQHVVIIIQENRSFDDLFADFEGADGATVGLAEPMPSAEQSACAGSAQQVITSATTVSLTEVGLTGIGFPTTTPTAGATGKPYGWGDDLPHIYPSGYLLECDSSDFDHPSASSPCQMNGFDVTKFGPNGEGPAWTCTFTYQYVNPTQILPYWDMAKQYVLADHAFQTQGSGSFTAHQDLIAAGTAISSLDAIIDNPSGFPWGCGAAPKTTTTLLDIYGHYLDQEGPYPCLDYYPDQITIRDRLDDAGVSWKYYSNQVHSWRSQSADDSGIWSAFDAIKDVRHSKEWGTKVVWPDTKIFHDINYGQLPGVAWVTPDGLDSDHPDERKCEDCIPVDDGPSWVASIVNKIGHSEYWSSTAIVVLWDDWGGYYDHVPPPFYDTRGGLGFRFPMLIISPYVTAHVEHTQYETASILKFIEENWGLKTLGQEDKRAKSIGNVFNFKMAPRRFKTIPSQHSESYFLRQKPSGVPPDAE